MVLTNAVEQVYDFNPLENMRIAICNFVVMFATFGALATDDCVVRLMSGDSQALVSPCGATVMSYAPEGGSDVLFKARGFAVGAEKFAHGGIPLAWPWFGRKDGKDDAKTIHGFARHLKWDVLSSNSTNVVLGVASSERTRRIFPYDFRLTCSIALGDALDVALEMVNTGSAAMPIGAGFHPFFKVANNTNVIVTGCAGVSSLSKGTDADCPFGSGRYALEDRVSGRRIEIRATGTDGVCVWNDSAQWPEVYADGGGTEFCCVEPILYGKDGVGTWLKPGDVAKIGMSLKVIDWNARR